MHNHLAVCHNLLMQQCSSPTCLQHQVFGYGCSTSECVQLRVLGIYGSSAERQVLLGEGCTTPGAALWIHRGCYTLPAGSRQLPRLG